MKISKLYIHSFRGIPNELEMDFTNKQGKPISVLIHGDNGSGKSSIIDAIEFNLQARIERSEVLRNLKRPSPLCWSYRIPVGVDTIITSDSGNQHSRGINVTFNKDGELEMKMDDKRMHPEFSIVPIALRRNDITSFNILPADKRQVLFFSFLYSQRFSASDVINDTIRLEDDPYILELREKFIDIKGQRRIETEKLAKILNVEEVEIPIGNTNKFKAYINSHLSFIRDENIKRDKFKIRKYSNSQKKIIDNLSSKIVALTTQSKEVRAIINEALNPSGQNVQDRKKENALFLDEASKYLSESFKLVSTIGYVSDIQLSVGDQTTASLDIYIKLNNGRIVTPNQIFSEANYDLLVLLLYVSLIRVGASKGQSKVLIIDDVLQSVDSTIRQKFINYILSEFSDWQFFVTTHDRLWLNQLRYSFQRKGHPIKEFVIDRWSFENGPVIFEQTTSKYDDSLDIAINSRNKIIIASMSGVLLEKICQKLSVSLEISIHRKRDDKYTIGDLWPGIKKVFKKHTLASIIEEIDQLLIIRNLIGSHYNEWAHSLSDQEVDEFAQHIQYLYKQVFCPNCLNWIRLGDGNIIAECDCRHLQFVK